MMNQSIRDMKRKILSLKAQQRKYRTRFIDLDVRIKYYKRLIEEEEERLKMRRRGYHD